MARGPMVVAARPLGIAEILMHHERRLRKVRSHHCDGILIQMHKDCNVEEYPFSSGRVSGMRNVLRLVPKDENDRHAISLGDFYNAWDLARGDPSLSDARARRADGRTKNIGGDSASTLMRTSPTVALPGDSPPREPATPICALFHMDPLSF